VYPRLSVDDQPGDFAARRNAGTGSINVAIKSARSGASIVRDNSEPARRLALWI